VWDTVTYNGVVKSSSDFMFFTEGKLNKEFYF